jgi:hypothetical protein
MFARIYQPPRSAMQSGTGKSQHWVLEYVRREAHTIDPVVGTVRSTDMNSQVELKFETLEQAVAYAKAHNIAHRVIPAKKPARIPRSYAENFDYDRRLPWTH